MCFRKQAPQLTINWIMLPRLAEGTLAEPTFRETMPMEHNPCCIGSCGLSENTLFSLQAHTTRPVVGGGFLMGGCSIEFLHVCSVDIWTT